MASTSRRYALFPVYIDPVPSSASCSSTSSLAGSNALASALGSLALSSPPTTAQSSTTVAPSKTTTTRRKVLSASSLGLGKPSACSSQVASTDSKQRRLVLRDVSQEYGAVGVAPKGFSSCPKKRASPPPTIFVDPATPVVAPPAALAPMKQQPLAPTTKCTRTKSKLTIYSSPPRALAALPSEQPASENQSSSPSSARLTVRPALGPKRSMSSLSSSSTRSVSGGGKGIRS